MTTEVPTQARHRPKRHSPTSLKVFETCPKQYEYAYVERIKVDESPGAELVFGNALHETLAFLHRMPIEERSVVAAHTALRHFWARTERAGAFLGEAEEIVWGKRALAVLDHYCANYNLEARPLAVERWVRAMLPNGVVLSGKADRVDRLADGDGLEVIDYKSGRCKLAEDADLRGDLGAMVYALATTQTFRKPVLRVRFLFIAEGVERRWDLEADDLASIETELGKLTSRVEQSEDFGALPGRHCDWCRFADRCPAQGAASLEDLSETSAVAF
jgi:putative RecB family exonuclease